MVSRASHVDTGPAFRADHWTMPVHGSEPKLTSGLIFDIKRFAVHDGPGIRTTVFMKGCPLHCWWCHNPEGQAYGRELMYLGDKCMGCGDCYAACPQEAIRPEGGRFVTDRSLCTVCGKCTEVCTTGARQLVGREVTAEDLVESVERDLAFYDESGGGVTFSGGEPLAQPELLEAVLKVCREHELRTAVETSGYAPTEVLLRISPLVDLFLYDLKLMDDERHRKYMGVSNKLILANLRALAEQHANIIIRIPIIPGMNDDTENLVQTAGFLRLLGGITEINLLPYHRAGTGKYERLGKELLMPETEQPDEARREELADSLRGFGFSVKVGG